MHPRAHYAFTIKVMDKVQALISYIVDLEPAKTVLHEPLYFHGGALHTALRHVPLRYLPGTIAHLFQDAYWDTHVRKYLKVEGNIWVHRLHEAFWTRKHFSNIKIDFNMDFITSYLGFYGAVDSENIRRHLELIEWLIEAPEEDVKEYFWRLIGYEIEPQPERIDELFDWEGFERMMHELFLSKPAGGKFQNNIN